ncbi:cache domain-containing protein [Pseudodesulfovibrio pelocollis]|uniref:cache domain-containing protein n=1 Tax=Pseudodesulfovibrio pelocollis TaxID=3051432 RepID=UPI00255ABA60|nr:cache domain-containing protein [Pseudodesulfovibrio sp. SB368]
MLRNRSFSAIIFISIATMSVVVSLVGIALWTWEKYDTFQDEAARVRLEFVEESKDEITYQVDRALEYIAHQSAMTRSRVMDSVRGRTLEAVAIAQSLVDRHGQDMDKPALERLVLETLRAIRFNDGLGYYFATRMDGTELLFTDKPELEGVNLIDMRSADGRSVIREMIALARERGQGFYEYTWTKPDADGNDHPKIAFIKYFEPFDGFIGTGEYVADHALLLQQTTLDWLVRIRFGTNGYLFGSTFEGDPLFTNGVITRGQASIWEMTGPDGVKIIQRQHEKARLPGGGFMEYSWHKLDRADPSPKIAFVRGVPEWGWIIGSGFYVDDVESEIAAHRAHLHEELLNGVVRTAFLCLLLVILALFAARVLSGRISRQLAELTGFLSEAATHKTRIAPERLTLAEFKAIATSVNAMLEARDTAEEWLRESEERNRLLADLTTEGVVVHRNGTAIDLNASMAALLGFSRDELLGRDLLDFIHEEDRDTVRQSMASEVVAPYTARLQKRDGSYFQAEIEARNFLLRGEECRVAAVRDVTMRRRAEETLLATKEAAEAASRSKSEFLANMSHEIRTPLGGMQGMLELLQTTPLDHEQRQYAGFAIDAAKRLTRLLGDILDLARIEAGKLTLVAEPIDLAETLRSLEQLFRPSAAQAGNSLEFSIAGDIPPLVVGDAVRLQQVVSNIVGNALKFTRGGSVTVTAALLTAPTPHPAPDAPPGTPVGRCRVLFSVSDTGPGIPDAAQGKLFQPFTQVSEGIRRQHQGAGLGLSICKRLVDLMGGTMSIESEVGVGTTVHFQIPFALAHAALAGADQNGNDECHDAACRILVAEDSRVNRLAVARLLEKDGHTVVAVENGRQALDALSAARFDVVFMDIQMPVMDGLEATRAIRSGAAGNNRRAIPIIALTAYAMAGDREAFLKEGMDGYLSKPVDRVEMRHQLRLVLEDTRCPLPRKKE